MSELHADPGTAAYVRAQAAAAGVSEATWLAGRFRDDALSDYAAGLGAWYHDRPGLLDAEVEAAEAATAEIDAA